jgi:hypothetical protein
MLRQVGPVVRLVQVRSGYVRLYPVRSGYVRLTC